MKNKFTLAAIFCAVLVAGVVWYVATPTPEVASDSTIEQAFAVNLEIPGAAVKNPGAAAAPAPGVASTPTPIPNGYRIYRNANYRFSLAAPPELKVQEFKEGSNAMTITFEDAASEKSFQVFVTPYSGSTITKERFKLDVPSGVMKEPVEVIIDGVRATMFLSSNIAMGDTREVWFIKNGFLYEVTTYADLDSWLSSIMSTWQFV